MYVRLFYLSCLWLKFFTDLSVSSGASFVKKTRIALRFFFYTAGAMHNTRVTSHHQINQQHQQHPQIAHQQKHYHSSSNNTTTTTPRNFTNTAKLPIETVKLLIAAISRKPHLWIRTNNGQKRSEINALWHQVSQEVHLPAEICRIKWGHLRDNFRKVFIRNTLSAEPPTTWRFYNDMRFMEPAVAENVMRHHRLREQSLYWQELHNAGQRHQSATPALNEAKYEHSLQSQLNFSEFAAIFQNTSNPTANKRIKLEASETSQTSLQEPIMNLSPYNSVANEKYYNANRTADLSNDDGDGVEDEDDDDDDDQFDEDAVSADENLSNFNEKCGTNDKDLNNITNNCNEANLTSFNVSQDVATNTESCLDSLEGDSERMFLLSLLPYLRKVKDHRKLQVRQKLQDVLIEEFG